MRPPTLRHDPDAGEFLALVEPSRTNELIAFLRSHLNTFTVNIGGVVIDDEEVIDLFIFPDDCGVDLLTSLLDTFTENLM